MKHFAIIFILFFAINANAQRRDLNREWLPQPVFQYHRGLVDLYWQAWEQAWRHIGQNEGLVQKKYMDEGLWDDTIWIWDSEFMALFCKYAPHVFPGIETLNNFYYPILEGKGSSLRIQHPDNPPFYAWIESEYYKFTDDKEHIRDLLYNKCFLQRYFDWFDNLKPGTTLGFEHTKIALEKKDIGYNWGGVMSGMDNSPRGRGNQKDLLWIDAICQQALSALHITRLAEEFGHKELAKEYRKRYDKLKTTVNQYYWDETDGTYYDIRESDHSFVKVITPASFWAMLAEIPSPKQAERMVSLVRDSSVLGGVVPWVSLSRNDPDFNGENGDYWKGSLWLPTAYMGIKALEKYGFHDVADETAYAILEHQYNTFRNYQPASIWECYHPSDPEPGLNNGERVRENFCGWSALGPISLFIENVLGFHNVDGRLKIVEWRKHHSGLHGIKNLKFGNISADIVGDEHAIQVESSGSFTLIVNGKTYKVRTGSNTFKIK